MEYVVTQEVAAPLACMFGHLNAPHPLSFSLFTFLPDLLMQSK